MNSWTIRWRDTQRATPGREDIQDYYASTTRYLYRRITDTNLVFAQLEPFLHLSIYYARDSNTRPLLILIHGSTKIIWLSLFNSLVANSLKGYWRKIKRFCFIIDLLQHGLTVIIQQLYNICYISTNLSLRLRVLAQESIWSTDS